MKKTLFFTFFILNFLINNAIALPVETSDLQKYYFNLEKCKPYQYKEIKIHGIKDNLCHINSYWYWKNEKENGINYACAVPMNSIKDFANNKLKILLNEKNPFENYNYYNSKYCQYFN